ncbi:sucrose phosphorylase [Candidatus Kaiserbacteria bacterium]|nr:sucrose phosphorylase [Candidatus Kaiserbacteria bacterium]
MLRNQVQLITYPDSLGGTLRDVRHFLDSYVKGVVGGVHILPFYPSSADRGFAPLTHLEVEPRFGSWDDIAAIGQDYDLVADLTVNHISMQSEYFQDYLARGDASPYVDLFLEVETVLERHGVELEAFAKIYRPRPTLPFSTFKLWDGTTKRVWTTFTNHQVDLDVESEMTRVLMTRFIDQLIDHGVNLIRLDAVGYTVKRPWTSSFLIPETYDFIRWLRSVTPAHVELLAEIHHDPMRQQELLTQGNVEWVYDFSLPLLVLHALYSGEVANLSHWITIRPSCQITTLDTHDGIGVVDVAGLMAQEEIAATTTWVEQNGGNHAYQASGTNADNVDTYQLNSTYYSALGEDDDAYITARAIQFFIPGIPQVYYVGLLAGCNDYEQFARTNHGRDVNRHNYTWDKISVAMEQPVVHRLRALMKLRSIHPAFQGTFSQQVTAPDTLVLRWEFQEHFCEATIDVFAKSVVVEHTELYTGSVKIDQF